MLDAEPLHGNRYSDVRRRVLGPQAAAQPLRRAAPRLQRLALAGRGRRADRRARGTRAVHPRGQGGRRAGPGVLHRAGRVRRRDARPGGLGEGAWPNSPPARRSFFRDCTGCGRRSSTSSGAWSTILVTPCRPTPTSRRRAAADSIPTTTSTTSSSCKPRARSAGPCTSLSTRTRCPRSPGPTTATPSLSASTTSRSSTPCCRRATRCICLAGGCIRRRSLDTTSIHMTIGVSALTYLDVVRAVVDTLAMDGEFRKSLPMGIDADRARRNGSDDKQGDGAGGRYRAGSSGRAQRGRAARLSDRHAERTRPVAVRPLATLEAAELAGAISVRWRHGLIGALRHRDGRVVLRLPDRTITFPESCAPAIEALHRGLVADAETLPGLDRADSTVLIRRLLREAVVVPAEHKPTTAPERG